MTKTIKAKLVLGDKVRYITGQNKGTLYEKAIAFQYGQNGKRYPLANYKDRPDIEMENGLGIQAKAVDGTLGYTPNGSENLTQAITNWLNNENAEFLSIEIGKSERFPNHSVFAHKVELLEIVLKFDIADLIIRETVNKEKDRVYKIKMAGSTARKYFERFIAENAIMEIY